MHAQFGPVPGAPFLGCDAPQGFGQARKGGLSEFQEAPTVARATEAFNALAEGGHVVMMLAPRLLVARLWHVPDRSGTRCMVYVAPCAG